jgi:hypothetical protein
MEGYPPEKHPLYEAIQRYIASQGDKKKVFLLGEVHIPDDRSRDPASDILNMSGKQIHIVDTLKKMVPSSHLFFELPGELSERFRGGKDLCKIIFCQTLKYNTMTGKMVEHFSSHKGTTEKLARRLGPPLERAGDNIYSAEIRKILEGCDSLIVIMGINHLLMLNQWLKDLNPMLINGAIESDWPTIAPDFRRTLPELTGPEFDYETLVPFFRDPDQGRIGLQVYESWKTYVPGHPGKEAAVTANTIKGLTLASKVKDLKAAMASLKLSNAGFTEKQEYIAALRAAGVTILEGGSRRKKRTTRKSKKRSLK